MTATTDTDQQPLTLADILKSDDATSLPADQAALYLVENWDIHLFIGHIDIAEANRRLAAKDQTLSGLLTVRGDFTHRHAIFVRHEESCDALFDEEDDDLDPDDFHTLTPDDFCTCEQPWYAHWTEPSTPGSIAVTTAFADSAW